MFKTSLLIFPSGHLFWPLLIWLPSRSRRPKEHHDKKKWAKKRRVLTTQATHGVRETKAPSSTPRPPAPPRGQRLLNRGEPAATALWERLLGCLLPCAPPRAPPPRPAPAAGASAPVCSPAPGVRRSCCSCRRCPHTHPHVKRPLFPWKVSRR